METDRAAFARFPGSLCDTPIGCTTETGHQDEDFDSYLGFGCLGLHSAAAQVPSDDLFVATYLGLPARILRANEDGLALEGARSRVESSGREISFVEVVLPAFESEILPARIEPGMYERATFRDVAPSFRYGCHVCELEIDLETRRISVLDHICVDDVDTQLHPMLVAGQLHGCIVQSAADILMEQMVYDESGQLLTGSFVDYTMSRAGDCCNIDVWSRPLPTKINPLGEKGFASPELWIGCQP